MDLRELKKEVQGLPNAEENINLFQNSWLKPFHKDADLRYPLLKKLSPDTRKIINQKLAQLQPRIDNIKLGKTINERLHRQAQQLINLKLSHLSNDQQKSKMIAKQLLHEEAFNFSDTIEKIKSFENEVETVSEQYEEVNELLQRNLSLEEMLFFMDLPHKVYLYNLIKTVQRQKSIARDLGRHFVSITKDMSLKKIY